MRQRTDYPGELAKLLKRHLRSAALPDADVLTQILEVAYFASMKTEESKAIACSLSFADPERPDHDPPRKVRHHRWRFFPVGERLPFSVRNLVKLAPVAQSAALSIAIFADSKQPPYIWGLVDQEIHHRRSRVFEADGTFGRPGLFQIDIQGIGHIEAYCDLEFVGALRTNRLSTQRLDALRTGPLFNSLFDRALEGVFFPVAKELGYRKQELLPSGDEVNDLLVESIDSWLGLICRVLHRIQRYRHGGALLITPDARSRELKIKHRIRYDRLTDLLVTRLAANKRARRFGDAIGAALEDGGSPTGSQYYGERVEDGESEDAETAIMGAVAFVAALSQIDGLVLLGPGLRLRGFGVEIRTKAEPAAIFAAGDTGASVRNLRRIGSEHFGTRHRSMFRYCAANDGAVGFVVSQDGDIRAITNVRGKVVMWEDLNLYNYENEVFGKEAIRNARRRKR